MLILAVDTSTRAGSLAVLQNEKIIHVAAIPREAPFSSSLFTHLQSTLDATSLALRDFELFAVCAGPGSFAGLRVGLTAAKAWAEVYQRPIAAVSGLQAIAAASETRTGHIAPFSEGGRGQVFGGLYRHRSDRLERVADDMILSPQDFVAFISTQARDEDLTFISTAPEAMDEALRGSKFDGRPVQRVSNVLAPAIGAIGYQQMLRNEVVDAYTLDANYIRRCDAEVLWKDPASKVVGK